MSQSMSNLHTLNMSTPNRERYHLSLNGFLKNSDFEWVRPAEGRPAEGRPAEGRRVFVIFSRNSVPFIKYAG